MRSRNNFALHRYMDGLQAQQLSFLRILNAITTIDPQSPNWTIALRSRLTGNRRCWHSFRTVGCVTKWEGESSQQLFVFDVSHQIPERRSRSAIMHFACHLTRRFTSTYVHSFVPRRGTQVRVKLFWCSSIRSEMIGESSPCSVLPGFRLIPAL